MAGKHHEHGSPEAQKHDPYGSYPAGIISPPDETRRGKDSSGIAVLAVRVGERWANVHPISPGLSYGIRWWMRQYEVDEL